MSSDTKPLEFLFKRAVAGGAIVKTKEGFVFADVLIAKTEAKVLAALCRESQLVARIEAALTPTPDVPPSIVDTVPKQASAEAPESAGVSDRAVALAKHEAPSHVEKVTLKLALPLPAEFPPEILADALVLVVANSDRGRMRAGRMFTREETRIPFAELSADQLLALERDPEIEAAVLVPRPPMD